MVVGDEVVGILGGRLITDICSNLPAYEELIWYVRKEHRNCGMRLMYHMEDWCKKNNINRVIMSCMHNSKTEKLFKLYKRIGFEEMETRFIKQIG